MSTEWQLFVSLNEQMRPLTDPRQLQELAVNTIGRHLHASRVNYSRVDASRFHVIRSYCDGVPPLTGGQRSMWGVAILAECAGGSTVVITDVATDARLTTAERDGLVAHQCRSLVATPLIKDG